MDSLHGLLRAVATENPASLSSAITAGDMRKLIKAYSPEQPGATGKKDAILKELVGAILSHEKFAVPDESIMLVRAPAPAAAQAAVTV
eukprot:2475488-Prymnesium_polylepis.1